MQAVRLAEVEYVPARQAAHSPPMLENVPTPHSMHTDAPGAGVYLPTEHGTHTTLLVAPAAVLYFPEGQRSHAVGPGPE
jgi:hypothetical protein